jgi:hypothetical protein
MKIRAFTSILALFLLSVAASHLTSVQAFGQSASGSYQFSFEDRYLKYVEFDARTRSDGSATGQLTLSDEAKLTYMDLDGTGDKEETYPGFFIKADLDGLVVNKNQAVMSGTVVDSSIRYLVGQRVLLTVEDNGDNTREPDRLTWGVYKQIERNWTPSDAERKEDPGVGLRWWATDAERKDDVGYEMPRSEAITTQSFPVSSYAFVDVAQGAGDIIVRA